MALPIFGEIRDLETASYAVQAALTGHLVFSTLHTNDAISCPLSAGVGLYGLSVYCPRTCA